jgi:hypothetical protein
MPVALISVVAACLEAGVASKSSDCNFSFSHHARSGYESAR